MLHDMIINSTFAVIQALAMLALSPLMIGVIRKIKAWF
jgi:formate hydrogenlyase subunit 4